MEPGRIALLGGGVRSGEAFRNTGQAMRQVLMEVHGEGADDLGDLDPKGVRIPLEFNRAVSDQGIAVRPALDLYRWLLANGTPREKPECRLASDVLSQERLGPDMGALLAQRWQASLWIPQESLGFEQLRAWD